MGVDSLGRYSLSTMQDRIRRLLDSNQLVVDTAGVEVSSTVQEQSYSDTDITNQLNESLTALYSEMIVGREILFASTIYLSTIANSPGPYAFPPQMLQLRWMKWKDPTVQFTPPGSPNFSPKPVDWYPMTLIEDPADWKIQEAFNAPTWRWEGGLFLLNSVVTMANTNGIQANIVTLPKELVDPTDVITIPQFVRVAQQTVIYDAAYTLAFSRRKQVAAEISKKRDEWHARLLVLVENSYNVASVQMVAPARMIRNTYTGRFKRIAGNVGPGGSNW